jgi:hypothetical protein
MMANLNCNLKKHHALLNVKHYLKFQFENFSLQVQKKSFQKNNFSEYKNILSGTIEYEKPNPQLDSFLGYLKIKKDPKVEQLSFSNFLPRGAVLAKSEW